MLASPQSLPEFPKRNIWSRITPSVAWCGDPESTVTIEVHIAGRSDVRKVWVANLAAAGDDPPLEVFDDSSKGLLFYDDGSHGDVQSGDFVFTHNEIVLPCAPAQVQGRGWATFWGYVRVELADGTRQGESFGMLGGLVDPKYKDVFEHRDLGNNLSASAYAFFINDAKHEVMDSYPVSNVYCGTGNYEAYRKLYSVLPDAFDIALITPGMQIFRPEDLYENVPYDLRISNSVQHIGLPIDDRTSDFGSSGRLKSAVYHSFGTISISTHEIGHTWGVLFGRSLGLVDTTYGGHWSALTDIGGQMGMYFYNEANQQYGHFQYHEDAAWNWTPNTHWEPYSPLELYLMGLIPSTEVPPIHILETPDLSNLSRITATSYQTFTIDQLMQSEGGSWFPSVSESQKDLNLAFIVTQDSPYTEAAYAFFSLMSFNLMSKDPPGDQTFFAAYYWATGGRGTLNSRLPVDVADPAILPEVTSPTSTATVESTRTAAAETPVQTAGKTPASAASASDTPSKPAAGSPICNFPFLVGGLTILPGAWIALRRKTFSRG